MVIPEKVRRERAFKGMQKIGLQRNVVSPILEKLLELYDNAWDFIEEENYRALADAVFESQEEQERSNRKLRKGVPSECGAASSGVRFHVKEEDEEEEEEENYEVEYDEQWRPPVGPLVIREPDLSSFRPYRSGDYSETASSTDRGYIPPGCRNVYNAVPEREIDRKGKKIAEMSSPKPLRIVPLNCVRMDSSSTQAHSPPAHSSPATVSAKRKIENCSGNDQQTNVVLKKPRIEEEEEIKSTSIPVSSAGISADNVETGAKNTSDNKQCPITNSLESIADVYSDASDDDSISPSPEASAEEMGNRRLTVVLHEERTESSAPATKRNNEIDSNLSPKAVNAVLHMLEDKTLKYITALHPAMPCDFLLQKFCQNFLNSMKRKCPESEDTNKSIVAISSSLLTVNNKHAVLTRNTSGNKRRKLSSPDTEVAVRRSPRLMKKAEETSNHEKTKEEEVSEVSASTNMKVSDSYISKETLKFEEKGAMITVNLPLTAEAETENFEPTLVTWEPANDVAENERMIKYLSDITKGEESIPIQVVNDVNSEACPSPFHYIPSNIIYQSANVKFSLAKITNDSCCLNCLGDCLDSPAACDCAFKSKYGFAYTSGDVLRNAFLEEVIRVQKNSKELAYHCGGNCALEKANNEREPPPCKGHPKRIFIRECWNKCGCSRHCGNRVVQRGIKYKLQVFYTAEGKGWGLRSLENIPKGAFVCEFAGEVLTISELSSRVKYRNEQLTCPVLLDAAWYSKPMYKDDEALCLDGSRYGNIARFINHRCSDANLTVVPVQIESRDWHYYHVALFTTRNVGKMEELTWDYGIDFSNARHQTKAFQCLCGSSYCRDPRRVHRSGSC